MELFCRDKDTILELMGIKRKTGDLRYGFALLQETYSIIITGTI